MSSKSFKSHDSLNLFYREWPINNPKAHIALIHGYGEHIGRYERLAADFNAAGFHVHGYDHRNHGQSPGKIGYVERFFFLVEDANLYLRHLRQIIGNAPLFVLGHSMGGLILARCLETHKVQVDGAIFSSPFLQVGDDISPALIAVGNVLSKILPWLPVVDLEPEKISRIPEEVAAYKNDTLVFHSRIVARTGGELNKAVGLARAEAKKITLPAYILHGTDDKLAPYGGGQYLHDNITSNDKTLKLYDGGYHELFNDIDREIVVADLLAWLNQRV